MSSCMYAGDSFSKTRIGNVVRRGASAIISLLGQPATNLTADLNDSRESSKSWRYDMSLVTPGVMA